MMCLFPSFCDGRTNRRQIVLPIGVSRCPQSALGLLLLFGRITRRLVDLREIAALNGADVPKVSFEALNCLIDDLWSVPFCWSQVSKLHKLCDDESGRTRPPRAVDAAHVFSPAQSHLNTHYALK